MVIHASRRNPLIHGDSHPMNHPLTCGDTPVIHAGPAPARITAPRRPLTCGDSRDSRFTPTGRAHPRTRTPTRVRARERQPAHPSSPTKNAPKGIAA